MLYYIIPPIIIILGLSVLFFFLFRKVSDLPEGVVVQAPKSPIKWVKLNELFAVMGHWGLKLLERLMQKAKLFSLKFHNTSNDWFHSIRKKREQHRIVQLQKKEADAEDVEMESEVSVPIKQVKMERKVFKGATPEVQEVPVQKDETPVIVRRPRMAKGEFQMVSEKVTQPESKAVATSAKSKLEDALIKRIAVNPRDIEAYERLGDYYIEQDNMADALECYRQVLRLSPVHYKAKMKVRKLEGVLGKKL